jgi:hypothetical protein
MYDCVVDADTVDNVIGKPQSKMQDTNNTFLVTSTPNQNGGITTNHR